MQRNKEKKENIKRGRKYIRENTTIKKTLLHSHIQNNSFHKKLSPSLTKALFTIISPQEISSSSSSSPFMAYFYSCKMCVS
jgi:hypothetical protein